MKFYKSGTAGWVLLTLYVFGWDYGVAYLRGGETLSNAFEQATRHPIYRWPVVAAWAVTTVHLFGWLPERIDPFKFTAKAVTRANKIR